jgi:hypothetical protein
MFITPKVKKLPSAQTGAPKKIDDNEIVQFMTALLDQRGQWYAFWEADVSHLSTAKADSARAKSRRLIKSPRFMELLEIQNLELEYATRKLNGVLTAYARIR